MVTTQPIAQRWVRQVPSVPRPLWVVGRLAAFVWISIVLTFPDFDKFKTYLPGDPGDAFLVFTLLRWGADRSTSLYSGYWAGPMFASGSDAMSYTETFLPLTAPFRLIEAITGSPILAMNVLYVGGWALCAECTYLLLSYLTRCRSASFVGSLAFTFATIRLAQTGHFQLVYAFCIPLAFLVFFKLLERPSWWLGLALGLVLSCQFLTTAYYGLILIVSIGAAAIVALIRRLRGPELRSTLLSLVIAGGVLAVLVLPVALRYSTLQATTDLRTSYPANYAMHLGDMRAAAPLSTHMNSFDVFRNQSSSRSNENFAYLGFFVFLLVPIAAIAAVLSRRFRALVLERSWAVGALGAAGAFGFCIAIGRGPILGVSSPFYNIAKKLIPGVDSMLAIVRLFVFTQLALVVVGTLALVWVLQLVDQRWIRVGICTGLALLIMAESSAGIPIVRVPKVQDGSVYDIVAYQDRGVVADLPITPREQGVTYAFLEATRQLLNSNDDSPTINGYSGFAPTDYNTTVELLNRLPEPDAVAELVRLDVRYVVLHTSPIDTGLDPVSTMVNDSGYAYMSPAHARTIVDGLPDELVVQQFDATDGVVLELAVADS